MIVAHRFSVVKHQIEWRWRQLGMSVSVRRYIWALNVYLLHLQNDGPVFRSAAIIALLFINIIFNI